MTQIAQGAEADCKGRIGLKMGSGPEYLKTKNRHTCFRTLMAADGEKAGNPIGRGGV